MTIRKLLKFVMGLVILIAVAIGLTSINHPIILKWVTGSARHFGTSIPATVYTNGQVNDQARIFYTDEPNQYLMSLAENDSFGIYGFFKIDLAENSVGRSTGSAKKDYDFIAGHLFLSKTAGQFSPIQEERKGSRFDPQVSIAGRQIKFNMPPDRFRFDSVRIQLH